MPPKQDYVCSDQIVLVGKMYIGKLLISKITQHITIHLSVPHETGLCGCYFIEKFMLKSAQCFQFDLCCT